MIRALKENDIDGLNKLPPSDWMFEYEEFLKDFQDEDFFYAFVMIENNKIIGTGNVLLKGKIGWLANIIVDEKYRGQGLGLEMTQFLVDFLISKGCKTQLLIATDLGEAVYQKVGFKKVSAYQCFDSESDKKYIYPPSIHELREADMEKVYELDKQANDENRKHLIDKYSLSGFGYFGEEKELLGFYFPNFGRGLIVSTDEEAGIELLKLKHSRKGKRTMLPIENQAAIEFLEKASLRKGTKCSRMVLGKENKWSPKLIYSYASGYCG